MRNNMNYILGWWFW